MDIYGHSTYAIIVAYATYVSQETGINEFQRNLEIMILNLLMQGKREEKNNDERMKGIETKNQTKRNK